MSGPLTRATAAKIQKDVTAWPAPPRMIDLEMLLRWLAKWRSQVLAETYISRHGRTIAAGLFAGMDYLGATEGSLLTRLLGTYEAALQVHMRQIIEAGVDCVIDVGCAEGYYAVGLARAFPGLTIHARDISETAREACEALAEKNGVSSRVIVGGEFGPQDFEAFAGRRVLVLVDAEGAEVDILQPALSPALAGMSIIVETHDSIRPGALEAMTERFAPTHDITRVDQSLQPAELPAWLMELSELDQLLARWEWRHRLTPWLVMRPRNAAP